VIGGTPVVDAVVHPYDLGPDNRPIGDDIQLRALHPFHVLSSGGPTHSWTLTEAEFFTDFDHDALTAALFVESGVDIAIIHALPNLGFTKGGVTDVGRMAELRDRHPGRYLLYATVDTPVTDVAIKQLEHQVANYGVDGLKLYPAFFSDGEAMAWRLDDDDFATPLLEAAQDLGVRNVAIHKALVVPPAPDSAFRVEDLDEPLDRFPSINFAVVHAGVVFLAETCELLARHPNLFANLESSFAYILSKPRRFAEMVGSLLLAAGPDRLLFGSGANLVHPRPLLDTFSTFEMPADLVEEQGFPVLSEDIRAKILGGNALRIHGLEPDVVRRRIDGDRFEQQKAGGLAPYWSELRR
jgi:predicted TIM-barrel fold metal-dependent hydrolase